jgi:GTP-binding protein LepA
MDVVQERLEREYGLNLILTAPSVVYRINLTDGSTITLDNPSKLPEPTLIESIEEPYVKAAIMTPKEYIVRSWNSARKSAAYISTSNTSTTRA